MSTNTKIYFALALALVAVFGVTVIKMSVPDDPTGPGKVDFEGGDPTPYAGEMLRAEIEHIRYEPQSDQAAFREYPGYFEKNDHPVPIWFCNPNPVPIKLKFEHTSCGACSFVDVAVIPSPKIDPTAPPDPFGAIIGGVMGRAPAGPDDPVPFGLDVASYAERTRLYQQAPAAEWQRLVAANSNAPGVGTPGGVIDFPAGSKEKPTWGVLRLNIKVNESKTLEATITQQKPGGLPVPVTYRATVGLTQLCEVIPAVVPFGELNETSGPVSEPIYYFSSTRSNDGEGDARLPKPVINGVKGDPFLTFGPPVPLTFDERKWLADQLTQARKMPVRVAGGYKVLLTLNRTAPDPDKPGTMREIDLGPADRLLTIAPETGIVETPPKVQVKSSTIGAVGLDGGVISLGNYPTRKGIDKTVRLTATKPGIELETVPELNEPKSLRLTLSGPPETKEGRTIWTAMVKMPPGEGGGRLPAGSVVTLRIKATGQLVRLPVSGNGQN